MGGNLLFIINFCCPCQTLKILCTGISQSKVMQISSGVIPGEVRNNNWRIHLFLALVNLIASRIIILFLLIKIAVANCLLISYYKSDTILVSLVGIISLNHHYDSMR